MDTVLDALNAPGGMLLIPRCRAMEMHDVALTALGYDEHDALPTDGRVEVIGLRPGEKMHESLLQRAESVRAITGGRPYENGNGFERTSPAEAAQYIYVLPPDALPVGDTEWEVVSNRPPGGWIGPKELRAIVAESAAV